MACGYELRKAAFGTEQLRTSASLEVDSRTTVAGVFQSIAINPETALIWPQAPLLRTADFGTSQQAFERRPWGRLQNGSYMHSGSQNRPVRSRPQSGRSSWSQRPSASGAVGHGNSGEWRTSDSPCPSTWDTNLLIPQRHVLGCRPEARGRRFGLYTAARTTRSSTEG